MREILNVVFHVATIASRISGEPEATARRLGELLLEIVGVCPGAAPDLTWVVQELCDVLPLEQARHLWPVRLHLRVVT